jgi:hypothetical protein
MVTKFEMRITTQLKSWLAAVGIEFEDSTGGLVVTSKEGAKVPVAVVMKGPAPAAGISILAKDVGARDMTKALKAFGGLQQALGYTPPKVPVDRGPVPTRKAHFGDDFELVALRHNDFRRSPNPTNAELMSYETVVKKAAWWFWKKNIQNCADHGLELEDLYSYARAWTCSYLALYKSGAERKIEEKHLCQSLKQRFLDFKGYLAKKARNVLPMLDDAYIAIHGRPYEYTNKNEWYATDTEVDNDWEIPGAKDEEDEEDRDHTKTDAVATLDSMLDALPHEKMVGMLSDAVKNDRIHLDARRAASRRLQLHARKCAECSAADLPRAPGDGSVPNNLPIVDENGTVFASAREAAEKHGVLASNVRKVLAGDYTHTGGHRFSYVKPVSVEKSA